MKRILLVLMLLSLGVLSAQTGKGKVASKYKNLQKLKSKQEEEIKVEIKKPDNDALLPRTETISKIENSLNIAKILKKSNKLLY